MLLYMIIAPGQGQIISDDKISKQILSFCYFNHFMKFQHDTLNSKGTRGQIQFFCTLVAGADNSDWENFECHRKLFLL